MKKLFATTILLALCGCASASVLSNDGTVLLKRCYADNWVTCVSTACPNGADVVSSPPTIFGDYIIKCKP